MNEIQLNLARKWRARDFDQIIGQELSVKILKNSLYRGHFFPVYLFWGQRGTGKTSMARIFAAAINCENLTQFQQEPKNFNVPCMQCNNCLSLYNGKHPDFIELDAASHTGVDNIRNIIDSAALLPLMGKKKIYLVDEAHMLSKAAFNALLKILEEPPVSALFILATTDPQKIIETVRSRCFQIWFKSVDSNIIIDHLKNMCAQEAIYADKDALSLIVSQSEGSVRDAINMLEQVRFSQGRVTKEAILLLLGHIDDETLIALFGLIARNDTAALASYIHDISFEQFDADYIIKRTAQLLRMMLWTSYGLTIEIAQTHAATLKRLASHFSSAQLTHMLDMIYSHERLLSKTTGKHLLLEMLFLKMCSKGQKKSGPTNPASQALSGTAHTNLEPDTTDLEEEEEEERPL